MGFKSRKTEKKQGEGPAFQHASGYTDLESVLGDHTLNPEREAHTTAPKGYRARSIAKSAPRR
jgi:hypothetical protein